MPNAKLTINRDVLEGIFKNHKVVRQFEDLFAEVDALKNSRSETIVSTTTTETIDITNLTVISQATSGITTSLSNVQTGDSICIDNVTGGTTTANITLNGVSSPTIAANSSINIFYNGTEWRSKG